jgi:hypothetical protein
MEIAGDVSLAHPRVAIPVVRRIFVVVCLLKTLVRSISLVVLNVWG